MRIILVMLALTTAINMWGAIGFVVNSGSETLSKINFATGEVEEVFCVLGSIPNRVGLTSDFAYVVNSGDNSIQKIDMNTGSTLTNIYIENSSNPYDIIINEDHAYVTGGLINKVYKVDLDTDSVVNSIPVGGNPAGMAILNDNLYVGNSDYGSGYTNCSVSVINLDSFSVEETIPVEINPQFLAVFGGNIHVSCGGDWNTNFGKICIIDPSSNTVTDVLDIGGVTSNLTLMANNTIYVGDGYGTFLYAYNSENLEILHDNTNPFTPGGTMVASNEENLFVLGGEWEQNFSVKVFDINENILDEFQVGLYAVDIKILPEPVSVQDEQLLLPDYYLNNYPNPFNPSTIISFKVTQISSFVALEIYNLKGQIVNTLFRGYIEEGIHTFTWDGTDTNNNLVSSGVYFYNLVLDGESVDSNKCILIK